MPSKEKIVYAPLEELQKAEAKCMKRADDARADIGPAIDKLEKKIQGAIQALSDQVGRNAQAAQADTSQAEKRCKDHANQSIQDLFNRMSALLVPVEANIVEAENRLNSKMDEGNQKIRADTESDLKELAKMIDDELTALKDELLKSISDTAEAAQVARTKLKQDADASIKEARKEAKAQARLVKEAAEKDLKRSEAEQVKKEEAADAVRKLMDNDIFQKLDRHDELLKEGGEVAEANLRATEKVLRELVAELRRDAEDRLNGLEDDSGKLRTAVAEVENLSTRRVDWVIKDVSKRVRPNSPSKASLHRSWFSPRFNMAGSSGLQLELQLYRPSDPPAKDQEVGDAAVFLWACKGANLVYRLYIGDKYQTVEKVFNGRVPFGTKRFCFLKDQIKRVDDTLTVSVEVLEAKRNVEHIIEPPPETEVPLGIDPPEKPLDGTVLFHRHVNNRLYEQVKGQAICSTQFNAAGIEGLQLLFYPSGYSNVTEGFCSLYVYGPAGCTVRCQLCLGAQKREAYHSFEEPGAFGRTNFCRFESIIDESDDTVLVAIEIEEAHHDYVAKAAHPAVVPGDRRTQAQIDGTGPTAITSVVKLKAAPGRHAQGLEDLKVLPSLWMASLPEGIAPLPEGTHTFDDLASKTSRGSKNNRTRGALASPSPESPARLSSGGRHGGGGGGIGLRMSESSPSFHDSATQGDGLAPPLPRLARTDSSFEPVGRGSAGGSGGGASSNSTSRHRKQWRGMNDSVPAGLAAH
eukprot:TRINITY_DN28873_c0_g1_i2.p1 TRINITY_DN28873_c0_g1~~TRINITY_DN28873_c0_g1_i2.p1  ORF type:complete len:749 (+),score=163.48 TRINITY_DN28873_c0_g1_i2:75-2321(+)